MDFGERGAVEAMLNLSRPRTTPPHPFNSIPPLPAPPRPPSSDSTLSPSLSPLHPQPPHRPTPLQPSTNPPPRPTAMHLSKLLSNSPPPPPPPPPAPSLYSLPPLKLPFHPPSSTSITEPVTPPFSPPVLPSLTSVHLAPVSTPISTCHNPLLHPFTKSPTPILNSWPSACSSHPPAAYDAMAMSTATTHSIPAFSSPHQQWNNARIPLDTLVHASSHGVAVGTEHAGRPTSHCGVSTTASAPDMSTSNRMGQDGGGYIGLVGKGRAGTETGTQSNTSGSKGRGGGGVTSRGVTKRLYKKYYSNPTPSSHCHVCARTSKAVEFAVCARIAEGLCRKVTCYKCFVKFGWDWAKAKDGSDWVCVHCRGVCPEGRSQCFIYSRVNSKRESKRGLKKRTQIAEAAEVAAVEARRRVREVQKIAEGGRGGSGRGRGRGRGGRGKGRCAYGVEEEER